jgi:hypothetical protein
MRIKVKSDQDLKNQIRQVLLTESDGQKISGVLV